MNGADNIIIMVDKYTVKYNTTPQNEALLLCFTVYDRVSLSQYSGSYLLDNENLFAHCIFTVANAQSLLSAMITAGTFSVEKDADREQNEDSPVIVECASSQEPPEPRRAKRVLLKFVVQNSISQEITSDSICVVCEYIHKTRKNATLKCLTELDSINAQITFMKHVSEIEHQWGPLPFHLYQVLRDIANDPQYVIFPAICDDLIYRLNTDRESTNAHMFTITNTYGRTYWLPCIIRAIHDPELFHFEFLNCRRLYLCLHTDSRELLTFNIPNQVIELHPRVCSFIIVAWHPIKGKLTHIYEAISAILRLVIMTSPASREIVLPLALRETVSKHFADIYSRIKFVDVYYDDVYRNPFASMSQTISAVPVEEFACTAHSREYEQKIGKSAASMMDPYTVARK